MTKDFNPTEFLSSLRDRHQTLEDLRSELRARSQDIRQELLELVNENYQDFLGLGSSLRGGDERTEEVRLGLLSFKKEVEGLRGRVEERKDEIQQLMWERKKVRGQIQMGRRLLDVEERIGELEQRLMLAPTQSHEPETNRTDAEQGGSDEESDYDGDANGVPITKLRNHSENYLYIRQSISKIGDEHPFLIKQEERVRRLKQTILLDLDNAFKQAVVSEEEPGDDLLNLLNIYHQMGHPEKAVALLKELKLARQQRE